RVLLVAGQTLRKLVVDAGRHRRCACGGNREAVVVGRDFRVEQGHVLRPCGFAKVIQRQAWSLAGVKRRVALKIRQLEIRSSIAAIGRPEQREQRRILRNREQLASAERPAEGGEVERENPYLGDERV